MKKFQSKSFAKSIGYALNGLRLVFKTQRNFRKHLVIGAALLAIALWMQLGAIELCIIIMVNVAVLICELINSIIEFIIDAYYKTKWAKLAKLSKDMGASVVLLASVTAVLTTSILAGAKIFSEGF